MRHGSSSRHGGFTLLELLLTMAVAATLTGLAIPVLSNAADDIRTSMAARYLASRIRSARMDAVRRATSVALRLEPGRADYSVRIYADGNGNGVRSADIDRGLDPPLGAAERLADNFPGVRFGLVEGASDADGEMSGAEGVRIGIARILTLGPDGTATPGTLYVRGRRAQYAVRVFGFTGRTRVLWYRAGARTWIER